MIAGGGQHLATQMAEADPERRLQGMPQEAGRPGFKVSSPGTESVASLIEAALLHWDSDGAAAKQLVTEAFSVLRPARAVVARCSRRPDPMPHVGLVRWKATKALAYMEANLGSKLDIGKLSDLLALSKSHFCRAFKCSFGVPPMVFLNSKRIARARELLATTEQRLSEIAVVCGFADQSHMTRCFKRTLGLPPGRWRSICMETRLEDTKLLEAFYTTKANGMGIGVSASKKLTLSHDRARRSDANCVGR